MASTSFNLESSSTASLRPLSLGEKNYMNEYYKFLTFPVDTRNGKNKSAPMHNPTPIMYNTISLPTKAGGFT